MPEYPEVRSMVHVINAGKGSGLSRREIAQQQFRLVTISITHSEEHKTMVADRSNFTSTAEDTTWAPNHWTTRSDTLDLRYLLENGSSAASGPLICLSRGKILLMAAGHHAAVISLSLEANIVGMKAETFWDIVSTDYRGPNKTKGEKLRNFYIPDHLVEPGSSPVSPRTIKLAAAFVSPKWAWALNDFTMLLLVRITSHDIPWHLHDLTPGSQDWTTLFKDFNGGPDWVLENVLASKALRNWCSTIILARKKLLESKKQTSLSSYVGLNEPAPPQASSRELSPIFNQIVNNRYLCFAGLGKHTISDFLHFAGIHPYSPSYLIGDIIAEFGQLLFDYQAQFTTEYFFNTTATIPNLDNPFSFNENANRIYTSKYIYVFRRTVALVPTYLYNQYASRGLLDPDHIIGGHYVPNIDQLLPQSSRFQFVTVFHLPVMNAYTIIKAQPPEWWGYDEVPEFIKHDIKRLTRQTTIGFSQFHEYVGNRVDWKEIEVQAGRPKTIHTGKPGRPTKTMTKKKLEKLKKDQTGRKSMLPPEDTKKSTSNKSKKKDLVIELPSIVAPKKRKRTDSSSGSQGKKRKV